MRIFLCLTLTLTLLGCVAGAQGLDGRQIHLRAGEHPSQWAPVALPYDGPQPADNQRVIVVESKTGKEFPATVREGEFVFVPEGATPNQELDYVVQLKEDAVPPAVQVVKKENADALDIIVGGKPFTTYTYSNDNRKPFLWPVLSEGGVGVTRDWPMGEKVVTEDHVHQKSFWTAYGDINGVDCWAETGEKSGYQHSDSVASGSGGAYGWIVAKNTWQDKDHNPVIAENREYRFYNTPESMKMVDVKVQFTAAYGDAKFGDTKEGGIVSLRMRDAMIEKNGTGVITNAEGLKGMEACWGKPSAWCDYSGTLEGAGLRGIAVFDNPANLRYPSRWHVRDYGLMGANCFGLNHFTKGEENGDYLLKNGEALVFAYRVYIHSGDAAQAKVGDRYADYVTPPKAEWAGAK
ncbi:MAG TPA: PmoA family protein [Candidatus Hydrogenedentes bacterium]|nr:PmoA family protein [Candidatus Hydrogenedentota bacterium]HQH67465.1 PmoA family protein [Candidatus Hydrogenedentota bacterium]HQM47810.1 PmoA family protein [Candidatus Hydrogenedentota bacterium]